MKRQFYRNMLRYLILSVPVLTILITCEKPERVVAFNTLQVSDADISYTSATLKGEITDEGSWPIEDHGIVYSTDPSPRIGIASVKQLGTRSNRDVFSANITGLTRNTKYYFRAFVTIDGDDLLADKINSFITKDTQVPVVTAGNVTEITSTSASLGGEVTSDGGEENTIRGLCWSKTELPEITSCLDTTINGTGTGTFTGKMAGLTPGTKYYARIYATNSKETSYNSAGIIFSTTSVVLIMTGMSIM